MRPHQVLTACAALGMVLAEALPVRAETGARALNEAAYRPARQSPPPRPDLKPGAPLLLDATAPDRSIDRALGPRVTGSAGFLCGRAPGHQDYGRASAYGQDPHGRFLGAQLRYSF